ncbi:MAG: flagellar assembly protein FliW [Acidimicrobiia bacterium]
MSKLVPATTSGPTETDIPVVHFATGLPAFPDAKRFALAPWGGVESPFRRLQCLDDPDLAFVVTEPTLFFPDYAPVLPDDAVERLALERADDALILVMVTVGKAARDATANLLGPIVVHQQTLDAEQVVLAEYDHSARALLASP